MSQQDFGLAGGFTSVENFEAYEASAPHQHCLSLLKPILAEKAGLEFKRCRFGMDALLLVTISFITGPNKLTMS